MSLEQDFEQAKARVRTLKQTPSNAHLLELYGLYKQGSLGDVQGKRPGIFDIRERAKFDAWLSRKGMSRDSAMQAYVSLVNRLLSA